MVVIFSTWWFFFKKFTVISPLTTTPKMSLTHPAVDNSRYSLYNIASLTLHRWLVPRDLPSMARSSTLTQS